MGKIFLILFLSLSCMAGISSTTASSGGGVSAETDPIISALNGIAWSNGTTPAAISNGTAAQVLTSNGAASKPTFQTLSSGSGDMSYANSRYVVKTFTRDLSAGTGDVAYTGAGFTPKMVFIMVAIDAGPGISWGNTDGTTKGSVYQINDGTCSYDFSSFANLNKGVGASQSANLKTIDSDGVTLTWTKTGSPTGSAGGFIVYYR